MPEPVNDRVINCQQAFFEADFDGGKGHGIELSAAF
jgi:hypothetical protein